MEKRVLHIDMDAFFASVEQVLDPSLQGKPLIVGGNPEDTRGVVCTASYEARRYGVHSAMPITQARRLCPDGIFMRGHFEHYRAASEQVRTVLETVSPLVEFASIDEAYVDISGSLSLFGSDDAIGQYVKTRIRRETQLPCTVAVASNKLVAKVACDEAKPDGYLNVPTGHEASFLRPLPLCKLPGAGPRTCEMLERLGVRTIGCLAELPEAALLRTFGPMGYGLQRAARGISTAPVESSGQPKSISRETTFEQDLLDWQAVGYSLTYLAERAAYALREHGMETKCVTLKVRYSDFMTQTFAHTLAEPTCVDADILDALEAYLVPKAQARRARIRLIGVSLSSLRYNQHQLYLFGREHTDKWVRALEGVDRIRARHGFSILRSARSMPLGREVPLATPSLSR
ncbi:MAG TPA: DNA polymerase IV [Candidatus Hydrogenedentes bacterium]|nr:DNA polymerase IV [Candidatus Hydrogenedentota bacterium]HPG65785.1 DNA polymerase IV [Candidatus Hydrogenedentota bacterium]